MAVEMAFGENHPPLPLSNQREHHSQAHRSLQRLAKAHRPPDKFEQFRSRLKNLPRKNCTCRDPNPREPARFYVYESAYKRLSRSLPPRFETRRRVSIGRAVSETCRRLRQPE